MDKATPNLPSRDFEKTSAFYARLGFVETWRDNDWLILKRGEIVLEFFPHPELDPITSWFSACLRLDDVGAFHRVCGQASIPQSLTGAPRLHAPSRHGDGLLIGALIDLDGSLIRTIQNERSS